MRARSRMSTSYLADTGAMPSANVIATESPITITRTWRSAGTTRAFAAGTTGVVVVVAAARAVPASAASVNEGGGITTTVAATSAATAPAAAAGTNAGQRRARSAPRTTGRSSNRYDSAATARVTSKRTASSAAPLRPVRSWLSRRNSGQWNTYTPYEMAPSSTSGRHARA